MIVASLIGGFWSGLEAALVSALNAIIAALATAVTALLSVLPDMPALPALPSAFTTAESWVAWVFPIGTVADILVWATTVWILWQAVSLVLRWAKAIGD